MKKNFILQLLPIVFFLFILNCKNNTSIIKKPEKILPLNILYKQAYHSLENGKAQEALELFTKVETNYSYTEWAPRATLMITYIYYETGKYIQAIEYANKFIKFYPANKNLPYAHYIIAQSLYETISVSSKDQTNSILAKKKFKEIIKKYPKTYYANESNIKIDLIDEQLAGNHMYIARYYMEKSKWASAIVRLKIIEKDYANTIYIIEALHRFVEIYYKLGNLKEAKKYASLLGYNFNKTDWYKKTYKIMGDKNYKSINKKEKKRLREKIFKMFNFSNDKKF